MAKPKTSSSLLKRALFVTPVTPAKAGNGIQQRAYRNLNLLADSYSVDLVIIGSGTASRETIGLPLGQLINVSGAYSSLRGRIANVPAASIFHRLRWHLANWMRPWAPLSNTLSELEPVLTRHYELTLTFRISASWVARIIKKRQKQHPSKNLIDFDDIESKAIQRSLQVWKNRLGFQKHLQNLLEMHIKRIEEFRATRFFDAVWLCSEEDRAELAARYAGATDFISMPNTIYVPPQLEPAVGKQTILFLGAMDYPPNIDAALFFTQKVLPLVRGHSAPQAQLLIVGSAPVEAILELNAHAQVTVTGRVEDVSEFYKKADIVVVPIRSGGGTRIKILEAMAYGRLVIATSVGCEGLGAMPGEHLLVADEAQDFALKCSKYLSDTNLRQHIVAQARAFVEEKYSYSVATGIFQRHYGLNADDNPRQA